MKNKLNRN